MARRNTTRAIPLNITILNTLLLFLLLLLLHPTHAHPQASPGDGSLQPNLAAPTPSTAQLPPPLLLQRDDTDTEGGSSSGGGGGNSGDGDPPPYRPIVTPPPDQAERLASMGYRQETFYTCNTIGGKEHCGWHNPIVAAADAAPARRGGRAAGTGAVVAAVGCLAGVFALGMM